MNIFPKFVGAVILLCLLPTIFLLIVDVIKVTLASLPFWVWVGLMLGVFAAVAVIVSAVRLAFGGRRVHHHHHYHRR